MNFVIGPISLKLSRYVTGVGRYTCEISCSEILTVTQTKMYKETAWGHDVSYVIMRVEAKLVYYMYHKQIFAFLQLKG